MVKFILVFLMLLVNGSMVAVAQNKIAVVPLDDSILVPIIIPSDEVPPGGGGVFLDEAFGKPMIFNKGWDITLGHRTRLDPSVVINFHGLSGGAVTYNGPEITHWGEQTFFNPPNHVIYAKAVLLIDKGNTVEGGPFEWTLNRQGHVSLINIVRTDHPEVPWLRDWTDPRPGDKVWFFIMSDDERFSSNPFHFIWP